MKKNVPSYFAVMFLAMALLLAACGNGDTPVEDVPVKKWGTPELIETGDLGYATHPQVAFDTAGNAMAVWEQGDGTRTNIWANRYVAGTGWGTPELIETQDYGGAHSPEVAFDSDGNAIAVWTQRDDGISRVGSIWANRYVAGTGWGTAELIETGSGDANAPQMVMDSGGNAISVWWQSGSIWSNRYVVGTGWGTAELIETSSEYAHPSHIAIDPDGNAMAVWAQRDGPANSIWANRYVAGTGWGVAELIENDYSGDAVGPQVAFDSCGNAMTLWKPYVGMWAKRYVAVTGWCTAEEVTVSIHAEMTQMTVDSDGNAMAIWRQPDGGMAFSIWANRYMPGTGWGTAEPIEAISGNVEYIRMASDPAGNTTAVWRQYDGTVGHIFAKRYVAGMGWGSAKLIDTGSGNVLYPQVAMDSDGKAIAVWSEWDGTLWNIWANRFE